jgi:low temperature requirement protein LtrA
MMEAIGSLTLGVLLLLPAIWLTKNQRRFEATFRAWLARHPAALWMGRIVVATMAVLVASLVAVLVLPLLPPVLFLGLGIWGYLAQRDQQHREVLTALRKR